MNDADIKNLLGIREDFKINNERLVKNVTSKHREYYVEIFYESTDAGVLINGQYLWESEEMLNLLYSEYGLIWSDCFITSIKKAIEKYERTNHVQERILREWDGDLRKL